MSMNHKAFLFDYDAFNKQLKSRLERALRANDVTDLVDFIRCNLNHLTDPYEGNPLGRDWETVIETPDAHQYGDFALTKYYDPTADIGLGASWEHIQQLLSNNAFGEPSPILGTPIGPQDALFDPGKMGAYFQSEEQVRHHHQCLAELQRRFPNDNNLTQAVLMLTKATNAKKGMYVTF